jgi:hypothetical protein
MKGVKQIEERGNISNDYITTVQDLSDMVLRIKQQGSCRELTLWCDHTKWRSSEYFCASVVYQWR